jgi:hypothetical protein
MESFSMKTFGLLVISSLLVPNITMPYSQSMLDRRPTTKPRMSFLQGERLSSQQYKTEGIYKVVSSVHIYIFPS